MTDNKRIPLSTDKFMTILLAGAAGLLEADRHGAINGFPGASTCEQFVDDDDEIIGYDEDEVELVAGYPEIIGADQDELEELLQIGARRPVVRRRRAVARRGGNAYGMLRGRPRGAMVRSTGGAALAQKLAESSALVRSKSYGRSGEGMIPINSVGNIAAGAAGQAQVVAQEPFLLQDMIIENPTQWLITNALVGMEPLFSAPGIIGGSAFSAEAAGRKGQLKQLTAQPGMSITFQLINNGGVPLQFIATGFGIRLRG